MLALIHNAAGIPPAWDLLYPASGRLLSPMIAVVAMILLSVVVAANGLRFNKMNPRSAS